MRRYSLRYLSKLFAVALICSDALIGGQGNGGLAFWDVSAKYTAT